LHYKDPVGYDSSNFGVRFFKFFYRRRSPAIMMVTPKMFVYPLYELLLIS